MRNGNIPVCLSLLFVVAVCTAAGISPLATQRAHIGPYQLLLSFYTLPRTEQLLHMTASGPAGSFAGDIPIDVLGPPAIPIWLGWLIGLSPLPLLIAFILVQVRWRKKLRAWVRQKKPQRSF